MVHFTKKNNNNNNNNDDNNTIFILCYIICCVKVPKEKTMANIKKENIILNFATFADNFRWLQTTKPIPDS